MSLSWVDTEAVAAALQAAHPEAEPLAVTPRQLHEWAAALPDFTTSRAADEKTLRAVQMLWYEQSQADELDVSG